jgi:hypothetical protein
MSTRMLTIAAHVVGFVTISVPMFAHHGTASYDTSKSHSTGQRNHQRS